MAPSDMTVSDSEKFTYLPVPEIVARLGLYVTGVGTDVVPPGSSYPRQQHPELYHFNWQVGRVLPEFQFVYVVEGRGEFESRETGTLKVGPGTVMTLFPDVWHRYRPEPESGWTEYWISLGGELLFQWHKRGLFREDRPLTQLRRPAEAVNHYQNVIDFVMKHPEQDAPMLTAQAMTILAGVLEQSHTSMPGTGSGQDSDGLDPTVREALRVVWNHSHQRVTVDMIANLVGTTRRTLERRFREQLGKTILQALVGCRIQRAKRLLAETHVPIKNVAHASGFSSLSNFCKVFRREIGATPGEYREDALQIVLAKGPATNKQCSDD